MKYLVLLTAFLITSSTIKASKIKLPERVEFASLEKGQELIGKSDVYTQGLSKFDFASKTGKPGAIEEDYLAHAKGEVLEWKAKEIERYTEVLEELEEALDAAIGVKFNLPKTIYLVKTTADEEGGAAGYTRGAYIVVGQSRAKDSAKDVKDFMLHELFHIISRFNPELRQSLYNVIGFTVVNEIELPKKTADFIISNPDAPILDSYINIADNRGKYRKAGMIIYSDEKYEKGSFFDYLKIGFVELEEKDGTWVAKTDPDNPDKAMVFELRNFIKGLVEQAGRNTEYIIDPEEILAENFVLAVLDNKAVPNPEIVKEIQSILKGTKVEF
ncbi:MAG: hypothetical protein KTR13_01345 [Saprospiraceae bacterium]|nr:hypothetical protein [Saprospiraceae bacterium]